MAKKIAYILGITIIGIGIGFILIARVGYGPWDIFYANLVELFDSNFTSVQAVISFILVMSGFVIRKKRLDLSVLVITITSAYMAMWIDIIFALNSPENQILGFLLLLTGLMMVAVGVNIARYTQVVLPALDFFIQSIHQKSKLTYGRIKQIIEVVVFIIGISLALIFDMSLKIGVGTIIIMFAGGYFINLTQNGIFKILKRVIG